MPGTLEIILLTLLASCSHTLQVPETSPTEAKYDFIKLIPAMRECSSPASKGSYLLRLLVEEKNYKVRSVNVSGPNFKAAKCLSSKVKNYQFKKNTLSLEELELIQPINL